MKATKYSQYLQNRENLQYVDTPHWIYIVEATLLTAIILVAGFMAYQVLGARFITPYLANNPGANGLVMHTIGYLSLFIKWGTLLFAVTYFISKVVFYLTTYIFASERRLYVKTGLLLARVDEINFDEIKSVEVNYGFFGRVLGYGKINMDARFVKDTDIPFVSNPENFAKLINYENDLIKDVNLSFATDGMGNPEQIHRIGETEQDISRRDAQQELIQKYEKQAREKHRPDTTEIIEADFEEAVMDDGEAKNKSKTRTMHKPLESIDFK